jgi:hypothetical protein
MDRSESDCVGGGLAAKPAVQSVVREIDGSRTGACSACGERFRLETDGSIPRHDRPAPGHSIVAPRI